MFEPRFMTKKGVRGLFLGKQGLEHECDRQRDMDFVRERGISGV